MYTLMHGFWKYVTQKDEYFVLILGLDNAGKTASLISFPWASPLNQVHLERLLSSTDFPGANKDKIQ